MTADAQVRAALASLPVITFTADDAGRIDWVSDRWSAATGIPRDALLGEAWAHVVHPDDVEHAVWLWTRALDHGTPWEATVRVRYADGTFRPWFMRAERAEAGTAASAWIGTVVELSGAVIDAIENAVETQSDAPGRPAVPINAER